MLSVTLRRNCSQRCHPILHALRTWLCPLCQGLLLPFSGSTWWTSLLLCGELVPVHRRLCASHSIRTVGTESRRPPLSRAGQEDLARRQGSGKACGTEASWCPPSHPRTESRGGAHSGDVTQVFVPFLSRLHTLTHTSPPSTSSFGA